MSRSAFLSVLLLCAVLAAPAQGAGRVDVLSSSDVDYLDPGRTYYAFGYMVQQAVHRTLYRLRSVDPAPSLAAASAAVPEIVPDLAAGAPEIGDGGRTVTVRLRTGVRYSPPVDREVAARDVAYALRRFFTERVGGSYGVYFQDLVGAPRSLTRAIPRIRGIETPDDHTLVFRLRRPTGAAFAAALILPATAPVPEEYARTLKSYGARAAFTGPYRVQSYVPRRRIALVRNPNWDPATDPTRPASLDAITVHTDVDDTVVAARQVRDGRGLVMNEAPPRPVVDELAATGHARFVGALGTRYLSLNTRVAPFNRLRVRRAVAAALDRRRLVGLRGGLGKVATHFLAPGVPGFEQAGGEAGTGLDVLARPRGDLALAHAELRKAGYRSGRLPRRFRPLLVESNTDPARAVAEVARRRLARIGLRVRVKRLPQDVVYTDWCQRPRRRVGICASAGWYADFPDGVSFLEPIFASSQIFPAANNNLGELRSRAVDRALARGDALTPGPERDAAAARADRLATAALAVVPFMWDINPVFASSGTTGQVNPSSSSWDLATLALG